MYLDVNGYILDLITLFKIDEGIMGHLKCSQFVSNINHQYFLISCMANKEAISSAKMISLSPMLNCVFLLSSFKMSCFVEMSLTKCKEFQISLEFLVLLYAQFQFINIIINYTNFLNFVNTWENFIHIFKLCQQSYQNHHSSLFSWFCKLQKCSVKSYLHFQLPVSI